MKKGILYTIVFLLLDFSGSMASSAVDSINVAPFGKVFIYNQSETPRNVLIIISGDGGWKYGVVGFAETFAKKNTLVIGIDILCYYKDLRQRTDECYRVATDFMNLTEVVEKKYNFPDYIPAILMGYSSGATFVYGILAQARPGTFLGGISLGFCPDIKLPRMLCQTNGLTIKADPAKGIYFLQPDAELGNPWIVLAGQLDKVCNYAEVADFVKKTTDAELISLPKVGHGFSKYSDFMPQLEDAFNRLIKTNEAEVTAIEKNTWESKSNLPIVITNSSVENKEAPAAILISGDGGWYAFEQSIANRLAEQGIPTIGLDSRKYFWKRRTPEETAADMAQVITYYGREWMKDKFLIIGYSLGAEIVPFIITGLPEALKSKVALAVMLSPETNTDFEIHISNMLGMGNRENTYLVVNEIKKMEPVPSLCIFGASEKSKIPELLNRTSVHISIIPGDHHYRFNVPLIVQKMKDNKAF